MSRRIEHLDYFSTMTQTECGTTSYNNNNITYLKLLSLRERKYDYCKLSEWSTSNVDIAQYPSIGIPKHKKNLPVNKRNLKTLIYIYYRLIIKQCYSRKKKLIFKKISLHNITKLMISYGTNTFNPGRGQEKKRKKNLQLYTHYHNIYK